MISISRWRWLISRWLVHFFVSALTVRVSNPAGGEHVEPRLLYRWVLLTVWWVRRKGLIFGAAICGLLLAAAVAWVVGMLQ